MKDIKLPSNPQDAEPEGIYLVYEDQTEAELYDAVQWAVAQAEGTDAANVRVKRVTIENTLPDDGNDEEMTSTMTIDAEVAGRIRGYRVVNE